MKSFIPKIIGAILNFIGLFSTELKTKAIPNLPYNYSQNQGAECLPQKAAYF